MHVESYYIVYKVRYTHGISGRKSIIIIIIIIYVTISNQLKLTRNSYSLSAPYGGMIIGDHFYKQHTALPLEDQMISAMPDIQIATLSPDDQFFVVACDGIW